MDNLETLKDSIEICPNCGSKEILGKFKPNNKMEFEYWEYCKQCKKEFKF